MNKTLALNVAIGVVLLAVLGLLIGKTRGVDLEAHAEIVSLLRQLKQVDAEWSVDVLRSKTGLNANYDPVASPLPLLESLENALRRKADEFWAGRDESGARVLPLLAAYKQIMDRKVVLIDRFKSQHAILRNSSRYLPSAAADAQESLAPLSGAARTAAAQAVDEVLTNALVYLNTPEPAVAERIEAGLAQLQKSVAQLPPEAAERVASFASHAATVARQELVGDKLLSELVALPTAKAIDELSEAHAQEHDKLLASQQNYRQVLLAYAALLLAGLAWVGWRLFRSYRMLNQANVELRETNLKLKESQMYMVQAEKMSALGQMVAGIAHEINTPLAYVKGTFEVLRDQVSPVADLAANSYEFAQQLRVPRRQRDGHTLRELFFTFESTSREIVQSRMMDEVQQLLKDGIHGIDQISEIVTNLKNFSRLDRAMVTEFSVHEGLESTLLLAKNLLKNRVEVRRVFDEQVPKIQCAPSQINQVFLNIVTNAVHAIPEDRAEPGTITLRTSLEGRDMVRVEIQDDGQGIPPEVLPRIFDPFFTTKEVGKGTGMGLSISYKIVEEHGGRIQVDTELGVGTVFSILLPIRPRQAAAGAGQAVIAGELQAA